MSKQKIAYVTGADRGLGLALTKVLIKDGYFVFAGRFMTDWPGLDELLRENPDSLTILSLDVSNDKSVKNAAKIIREETNYINLLINNAGSARDRSGTILEEQYFDDIRLMMEINAYGPLRVTQSVLDMLLKSEQKMLLNISSLAGSISLLTRINQYGYTMTKASLNIQSKLIHNHFYKEGLKVRTIHPGWMRSHVFGDIEKMKEAPFEPIDSAESILKIIKDEKDIGDSIFMDFKGETLPW